MGTLDLVRRQPALNEFGWNFLRFFVGGLQERVPGGSPVLSPQPRVLFSSKAPSRLAPFTLKSAVQARAVFTLVAFPVSGQEGEEATDDADGRVGTLPLLSPFTHLTHVPVEAMFFFFEFLVSGVWL